ncbi:MAG: hypothetical protein CM15mP103_12270 [Gammaproteobacteria bacterium]|nr:MAG: hypothetical protein CM15mP103_12270 [Gammaproteobacteria bacterium]
MEPHGKRLDECALYPVDTVWQNTELGVFEGHVLGKPPEAAAKIMLFCTAWVSRFQGSSFRRNVRGGQSPCDRVSKSVGQFGPTSTISGKFVAHHGTGTSTIVLPRGCKSVRRSAALTAMPTCPAGGEGSSTFSTVRGVRLVKYSGSHGDGLSSEFSMFGLRRHSVS